MLICGSGSFGHHHEDDEEEREWNGSPCRTPKRSKKLRSSTSFCKQLLGKDNSNKNPYADRGLDKFYALLADLEDKKQKIYTQKGSEDISFVRFVYPNDSDNRVKPIVVKVKDQNKKQQQLVDVLDQTIITSNSNPPRAKVLIKQKKKPSVVLPEDHNNTAAEVDVVKEGGASDDQKKTNKINSNHDYKKKRSVINMRCSSSNCNLSSSWQQPYCYLAVMVVLILLFLAIYGRSFAILCTSIGWYMMPTLLLTSSSSSSAPTNDQRKPKRKKEEYSSYMMRRQQTHKKVISEDPISPKSVINGLLV